MRDHEVLPSTGPTPRPRRSLAERAEQLLTDRVREHLQWMGLDVGPVIGGGTFGVVARAHDRQLDRDVALKLIELPLVQRAGSPAAGSELRALSSLRHPHVVPLYNAGTINERLLYLVMPWVEGATLRQQLQQRGPLPIEQVVRLGIDLADALAALHECGLVHRDLKPDNVLMDGEHAMLIDLGLVTRVRSTRLDTSDVAHVIGTPAYMSPEQWDAGAPIDGRSDLYSLGCLLYEVLTGSPPYTPRSTRNGARDLHVWTESLHTREDLERWTEPGLREVPTVSRVRRPLPSDLDKLVWRLMQPKPSKRYASAREVRLALEHIRADDLRGSSLRLTRAQSVAATIGAIAVVSLASVFMRRAPAANAPAGASTVVDAGAGTLEAATTLDPARVLIVPIRVEPQDLRTPLAERVSAELERALLTMSSTGRTAPTFTFVPVTVPVDPAKLQAGLLGAVRPIIDAERTRLIMAPRLQRAGDALVLAIDVLDAVSGRRLATTAPTPAIRETIDDAELRRHTEAVAASVQQALADSAGR